MWASHVRFLNVTVCSGEFLNAKSSERLFNNIMSSSIEIYQVSKNDHYSLTFSIVLKVFYSAQGACSSHRSIMVSCGFPGRDHIELAVCDHVFHLWFLIKIWVATTSQRRRSHLYRFFVITLSSQAYSHRVKCYSRE